MTRQWSILFVATALTLLSASGVRGSLPAPAEPGPPRSLRSGTADTLVFSRTRSDLGVTDSYTVNNLGWITEESRSGRDAQYEYRADGVRTSHTLNGRTAEFLCSTAGAVQDIRNAVLDEKLRAPYEDDTLYDVPSELATVSAAVQAVFARRGPAPFGSPAVIRVAAALSAPVEIAATAPLADDFDDGAAAQWDSTLEAGTGTVDPAQTAVRMGESGCAPRFDAPAAADQAYLETEPPDQPVNHTFAQSVNVRILQLGPATDDSFTLCRLRDGAQTLVEIDVARAGPGAAVLRARCWGDDGYGPELLDAGSVAVAEDAWLELSFVYNADTTGRFRWWVDGARGCPQSC